MKISAFCLTTNATEFGYPFIESIKSWAKGVDELAKMWAIKNQVQLKIHYPSWSEYGKAAGPMRNSLIVEECTHIIAFPSRTGSGTQDTIRKGLNANKRSQNNIY